MIYANDQWIQLPTVDLYDTQMMLASVQAARDMYEKGQQQIKDFNDKYGDFMTPIQKDMDWYNKNVTGRVQQAINNLYASGIDPLRSAEGRAAIQRIVSQIPVGTIQAMKANAATYGEWLKNKAELESQGLYDPNQDEFFNRIQGLPSAEGFSTLDDKGNVRMWNRLSPTKYKSLHDLIAPIVDNTKPGLLTPEEVNSFEGMKYDPMYDYTGISERMLRRALQQNIPGVYKDPAYQYYREIARQKVAARHPDGNYTQADVDEQLRNDAYLSVPEYLQTPIRTANPYRQAEYSSNLSLRNSLRLARERATRPTANGNGGGSGNNKKGTFSYQSGIIDEMKGRKIKSDIKVGNTRSYLDYQRSLAPSAATALWDFKNNPTHIVNKLEFKGDAKTFAGDFKESLNKSALSKNRYVIDYTPNLGDRIVSTSDIAQQAFGIEPTGFWGSTGDEMRSRLNAAYTEGKKIQVEVLDKVAGWATPDETGMDEILSTAQKVKIKIPESNITYSTYIRFGNDISSNYDAALIENSTAGAIQNVRINKTVGTNTTRATGAANVFE